MNRRKLVILAAATVGGALIGAIASTLAPEHVKSEPRPLGSPTSPMAISMYLWIVFSLYWEWAARNSSATKASESKLSRAFHLFLVNVAQLFAFWPFAGWPLVKAPFFEFPRVLPESPYLPALGIALQAGFILLAVWARRHLGRHWSGAVTAKVDHELVRSGPYRRIRHPIYTGVIGMYVGSTLVSGRLQGLLALAMVAMAYARKIRLEERNLQGVFGPAFDDYRRESWALVPGVF